MEELEVIQTMRHDVRQDWQLRQLRVCSWNGHVVLSSQEVENVFLGLVMMSLADINSNITDHQFLLRHCLVCSR